MSPMMSSQGVVLATAMAVSGTVILLALRLQRSLQFPLHHPTPPILRSCISSDGKRRERKKKKKKRVHFAEDLVGSGRDGDGEVRRSPEDSNPETKVRRNWSNGGSQNRGMPANRVALYNGILRDRVAQRLAYSY